MSTNTDSKSTKPVERRTCLVVGAGVAGLSAAHELAERGYRVVVCEKALDPRDKTRPDLGGLARTQWSHLPRLVDDLSDDKFRQAEPLRDIFPEGTEAFAVAQFQFDGTGVRAVRAGTRIEQLYKGHLWTWVVQSEPNQQRVALAVMAATNQMPVVPWRVDPNFVSSFTVDEPNVTTTLAGPPRWGRNAGRWPEITFDRWRRTVKEPWFVEGIADKLVDALVNGDEVIIGGSRDDEEQPVRFGNEDWDDGPPEASNPGGDDGDWSVGPALQEARELARKTSGRLRETTRAANSRRLEYEDAAKAARLGLNRALAVWSIIERQLKAKGLTSKRSDGLRWTVGKGSVRIVDLSNPRDQDMRYGFSRRFRRRFVQVRIAENLAPGEHGYRFFPAFYHHLFDTLGRIPLLEPMDVPLERAFANGRLRAGASEADLYPRVATGRTVFDNLCPVSYTAIATEDGKKPLALERYRAPSLRAVFDALDVLQRQMKFELRDLVRSQLSLLRFMTSCRARRVTYEDQTWTQFLRADDYGDAFNDALVSWAQALVGLRADEADARTFGLATVQLILDQVRDLGFRDGTLNAPTTIAWFDRWREYLELEQRVEFWPLGLQRLRYQEGKMQALFDWGINPLSDARSPADATTRTTDSQTPEAATEPAKFPCKEPVGNKSLDGKSWAKPDYLVMAVPLGVAVSVAKASGDAMPTGDGPFTSFMQIDEQLGSVARAKVDPSPEGAYRHLTGIQYYLSQDYRQMAGHIYYAGSAWRLSSISQVQFAQERPDPRTPYRGMVSVCVGALDVIGERLDASVCPRSSDANAAWGSDANAFARDVWHQMSVRLKDSDDAATLLPEPRYFHIDDAIEFRDGGGILRNHTPYMVDTVALSKLRPGTPGQYQVWYGNTVFCGNHLTTHTRLGTMEAANESARHAVNAVLKTERERLAGIGIPERSRNVGSSCDIFDPEEREVADLDLLKRLDAELLDRGLPHPMEVLKIEDAVMRLFDFEDGEEPPESLLAALGQVARSGAKLDMGVLELIIRLLRL